MHRIDRRAEYASLFGFFLQVAFFALLLILFRVNNSAATLVESWHFLAGAGIWFLIFIELYQKRLAGQQRDEIADLERQRFARVGGSASVFQSVAEGEELPMEHRLRVIQKWIVPVASLLIAGLLGFLAIRLSTSGHPIAWLTDAMAGIPTKALGTMAIITGVSLVSFIFSRYCLGLSRSSGWRVLRSGANYLTGNALICAALAVVLALCNFETYLPEQILAKIIPFVMLLLAFEMIINLIMGIYRPRIPGQEYQPCYESRILGLFCEPEGVMRSVAQTIDYQFGFQVSETWFFKLLQQTVAPLVIFSLATLYIMSSIVIVRPGQQAVVLHFGEKPSHTLKSGIHLKWPWPVDTVKIYPVSEVQQLVIGFTGESTWFSEKPSEKNKPILWTVKHVTGNEFQLLVASRELEHRIKTEQKNMQKKNPSEKELSPVSILAGALIIHYNIDKNDLIDYVANYQSPRVILESIAYRQWTNYVASVDPMEVMATKRDILTATLTKLIQKALDKHKSGIHIIKVALVGMHPPVEVADAFEASINARQERETLIWRARGDANQMIPEAVASAETTRYSAEADRYGKVIVEEAKANRFSSQLKGYNLAPNVFYLRKYLDVLVNSTKNVRKYILAVKHPERVILIVDDKEKLPSGIFGLGEEVAKEAKKKSD